MSASSPLSLPSAVPPTLKPIAHYLKVGNEHANRDPVVTYWCRLAALENGLKLDKKSKEALEVLMPLMNWLEKEKKVMKEQEAVSSEIVAAAHIENYAQKLFLFADREDRAAKFGKNVVRSFYTAYILYDVLTVLGELSPENAQLRKYAKWKATYIHNCLKSGQTPIAGPVAMEGDDEFQGEQGGAAAAAPPPPSGWMQPQIPPAVPSDAAAAFAPPSPPVAAEPPVPAPRSSVVPAAAQLPQLAEGVEDIQLTPSLTSQVQKCCKYAVSALDYDDRATAITNLTKALNLLKTGREEL